MSQARLPQKDYDRSRRRDSVRSIVLRYGLAVGAIAVPILIHLGLRHFFSINFNTSLLILGAIVAAAWYGGFGPGLTAVVLFEGAQLAIAKFPPGPMLGPLFEEFNRTVTVAVLVILVSGRKRAHDLLREQREWLRVALSSVGDAVIATDLKGRVIFVNPVAESLTGWKEPEAAGRPLNDVFTIIDEETRLSADSPVPKVLRDGLKVGLANHTMLIARDGQEIPIDDSAAPIKDVGGAIIGVILVFRDVASRRKNEKALRALQERFSKAFTASPIPMSIVSYAEARYVDVNEAFLQNSGYTREEIVGRTTSDINLYSDASERDRLRKILREQGRIRNEEVYRRVKNGEVRVGLASSEIVELEGERCILTATNDITDRKIAQAALRDSEEHYRAITETALDAIITIDESGTILFVNPATERIFGYTKEYLVGNPIMILMPDYLSHVHEPGVERYTSTGLKNILWAGVELPGLHKSGKYIPLEVSFAEVTKAGQKVFTGIVRDISKRKEAEAEAREARHASDLKSKFLASTSHELRTPLNAVIGFSEFLIDQKPGPLNAKQQDYLQEILNAGQHLLDVVDDILDLAKVEAGRVRFAPETFFIRDVLGDVCGSVKPAAEKKGIVVSIDASAGAQTATLDKQRFKQILYNLVSNAVKFTGDGGRVEIIASRVDNDRFSVEVRDTGIGIHQADIQNLFKDFGQIDAGRRDGTGLGLALTKKLVELQGGSISVESEFGKGTSLPSRSRLLEACSFPP